MNFLTSRFVMFWTVLLGQGRGSDPVRSLFEYGSFIVEFSSEVMRISTSPVLVDSLQEIGAR